MLLSIGPLTHTHQQHVPPVSDAVVVDVHHFRQPAVSGRGVRGRGERRRGGRRGCEGCVCKLLGEVNEAARPLAVYPHHTCVCLCV